ncbi:low specificity L-threonine aldolase [Rhodobacterales bacterium HKCCE2091]|nr:low specificity L-threonine aldolase [Rhodobacterales bacterium HKCCE2091]
MNFASDNAGPVAPEIMAALAAANEGSAMAYGRDPWTERAVAAVREVFDAPEASVHLVANGTTANALSLAALAKPWDAIFCHMLAHVEMDECGAPEFFTGGAKLRRVAGPNAKIGAEVLRGAIGAVREGDQHSVQRGPVTITQITELGSAYTLDEIRDIAAVTHEHGLKLHMDGARIANAIAAAGCSPAEMTWKAGVDALSLGGTKNGCMGVEAVVVFDPALDWEITLRRKRGGHLWSKHRYLGAQMAAYLDDGLWLRLAGQANARMAQVFEGVAGIDGAKVEVPPAGNMLFVSLPRAAHARAFAGGAQYHLMEPDEGPDDAPILCRVVCDWSRSEEDVTRLLELWRG